MNCDSHSRGLGLGDFFIRPQLDSDWDQRRSTIEHLYCVEDLALHDVIEEMKKLKFVATNKQFKRHIKRWGIEKNIKEHEYKHIQRIQEQRHSEGKETEFRVRNRLVCQAKIDRHVKKARTATDILDSPTFIAQATTPSDITYDTPPQSPGIQDEVSSDEIVTPDVPGAVIDEDTQMYDAVESSTVPVNIFSDESRRLDSALKTFDDQGEDTAVNLPVPQEAPLIETEIRRRCQLKNAADFLFVCTDDQRAFELYLELYNLLTESPIISMSMETVVISLVRSVRTSDQASQAKQILQDYFGPIPPTGQACEIFLPHILEIWLDLMMNRFDAVRVKRVMHSIVDHDGGPIELPRRGSFLDVVSWQGLEFGIQTYLANISTYFTMDHEMRASFLKRQGMCSRLDPSAFPRHCIEKCMEWCEEELRSGDFSITTMSSISLDWWQGKKALHQFCFLWYRWQFASPQTSTGLAWAQDTEEQLGISATELLLIVSEMILCPSSKLSPAMESIIPGDSHESDHLREYLQTILDMPGPGIIHQFLGTLRKKEYWKADTRHLLFHHQRSSTFTSQLRMKNFETSIHDELSHDWSLLEPEQLKVRDTSDFYLRMTKYDKEILDRLLQHVCSLLDTKLPARRVERSALLHLHRHENLVSEKYICWLRPQYIVSVHRDLYIQYSNEARGSSDDGSRVTAIRLVEGSDEAKQRHNIPINECTQYSPAGSVCWQPSINSSDTSYRNFKLLSRQIKRSRKIKSARD